MPHMSASLWANPMPALHASHGELLGAAYCRTVARGALRVLWLTKGLGPGGAERLVVALARTIDRDRFSCTAAYLLPEKTHLVDELTASGVESVCLEGASEHDLRWVERLRRLVVERNIDVVHVHAPYPAALARPVLRSLGRRRPAIVYTEHNSWEGYGRATRWANALTYPLDDARFVVSSAALESMPALFRRRTEVLIHGIDLGEVATHRVARERVRAELGVGASEVVVVTLANLRDHKDYPTLLGATRRALDAGAAIRVVAVGQGPLEPEVRAMADRMRLGGAFDLLGYRPDALDVLAAADMFTLSSKAEGYPVSLMEALALGLPVVATAVGGIPDAVRSGVEGITVPPERPDLLGDALVSLARDAHRRAVFGRAARARASKYDVRRATVRIEALYEEVRR
jgi:glycosyltransferase involved in cell wall biosynthesis